MYFYKTFIAIIGNDSLIFKLTLHPDNIGKKR